MPIRVPDLTPVEIPQRLMHMQNAHPGVADGPSPVLHPTATQSPIPMAHPIHTQHHMLNRPVPVKMEPSEAQKQQNPLAVHAALQQIKAPPMAVDHNSQQHNQDPMTYVPTPSVALPSQMAAQLPMGTGGVHPPTWVPEQIAHAQMMKRLDVPEEEDQPEPQMKQESGQAIPMQMLQNPSQPTPLPSYPSTSMEQESRNIHAQQTAQSDAHPSNQYQEFDDIDHLIEFEENEDEDDDYAPQDEEEDEEEEEDDEDSNVQMS